MESLFDNVLHYNYKDFSDSSAEAIPTGGAVEGLVLDLPGKCLRIIEVQKIPHWM